MTDTVAVPGFYGYTGATLHLHVDRTEHQRRQACGLGAISSPDVIAVVMALPHAEPIPWQDLSRYQRHVVKRAPAGIFDVAKTGRTPQSVTRLAVLPCRIVRASDGYHQLETPDHDTPASWAFAEQAYRSFLTYAPAALTERITTP